jgi:hypothetical protein
VQLPPPSVVAPPREISLEERKKAAQNEIIDKHDLS